MILTRSFHLLATACWFTTQILGDLTCKTTPLDSNWPSDADWTALNVSINGTLIRSAPVASSCYDGNPFNSTETCEYVEANWKLATFHAATPESVNAVLFANNSCLPPTESDFTVQKGCSIGGAPQYVVNATTEAQIAVAAAWASERNIRLVIKGTGHDLNGRSSGAYSLSIWTHNFRNIQFNASWPLPGCNKTEDVVIAGSGNIWHDVLLAGAKFGKVVVSGGAYDVGLGGFIQGGGHGPLSSTYGLAADQLLQARVITTNGTILVANSAQNQDLLWALRGGGGGQYGIVIEYILKAYPTPSSVVTGGLSLSAVGRDNSSIAALWNAFGLLMQSLPDLMDAGLAGAMTATTPGSISASDVALSSRGLSAEISFFGYNITACEMTAIVQPVITKLRAQGSHSSFAITWDKPSTFSTFSDFFDSTNGSPSSAGGGSMMSSRLLGRGELSDSTQAQVVSYLQRVMTPQNESSGGFMVVGLQGGPGPANVPKDMRGALNPVWRSAYLHTIVLGASIDSSSDPQTALSSAAEWVNSYTEPIWQQWAPASGAYMNEGNPFNPNFKHDFYGTSYDRLLEIKQKYDPTDSLFVLTGVGSDRWDYNLNTGKLCQTSEK